MAVTVLPEGSAEGARIQGGKQAFTSQPASDWVRPTDWPALPVIASTEHKFAGLVFVTNDDANYVALSATVARAATPSFTSTTFSSSSTDASTYTTASVTLTAGTTYLFSVENSHGTSASEVSSITGSATSVPTFTVRATTQFNSSLNRVTLLSATPTANWTGTLTMNFGGTTQTGACWSLVAVTGIGNLTADALVQSKTATGSSGTASVTLDSALATGSFVFAAQGHASTASSAAGSGYTEIHDVTAATPAQALQVLRTTTTGSTTVDATFTSAAWGIVAVELHCADYVVDWGDGTSETVISGTQANHLYTYSTLTTSVTTAGYKTAIVTVTPSGMFTTFNVNVRHPSLTVTNPAPSTQWLDILVSGPAISTLTIGASSPEAQHRSCQQVRILSSNLGSYISQFATMEALRSVSVTSQRTIVNVSYMFLSCRAITRIPVFNTTGCTNAGNAFDSCVSLVEVPLLDLSSVTDAGSIFITSSALRIVPALNLSAATTAPLFNSSANLARVDVTGLTRGTTLAGAMSQTAIENFMDNLGKASGAQTLTLGTMPGSPAVVSKTSSGTTSGATTVTIADTSSLTVGMEISGTGISDAVAATFQDTGDTVTRTAHGIPNGTRVAFATVVTTTGIATYTPYYVVNATANTFQVSDTLGGAAKALTTDGSGTVLYGTTITSIATNASVELSIPASATGSVTTSSALLKRSKARIRGFTVSG